MIGRTKPGHRDGYTDLKIIGKRCFPRIFKKHRRKKPCYFLDIFYRNGCKLKCARKLVRIIMACNLRKILSHKHRLTWCSVLHGRPSCQDKRCGPLFLLQSVNTSARQYKWRCRKERSVSWEETWVGLFRSCSATFEQVLAFGATFCGFSNSEQFLPFWAIFEKNIGLQHIPSTNWSRRFHRKKINTWPVTWQCSPLIAIFITDNWIKWRSAGVSLNVAHIYEQLFQANFLNRLLSAIIVNKEK